MSPDAAGLLLLRAPDGQGRPVVLLQRQAPPFGARWGLPGAARRGDETLAGTALRAAEQLGVDPGSVRVRAEPGPGPGGAIPPYPMVIADVSAPVAVRPQHQGGELAWVPEADVPGWDLVPDLAAGWPAVQATATGLLVDAANVVGSRPDGWWRDRAGAAERLLGDIAAVAPGVLAGPGGRFHWVTRPVVVLEGVARRAPDVPGVEVVRAPGSGDDTIVDLARAGGAWLVVTADRGLRARLPATARPVGPGTLRSWLSPPEPRRGGRAPAQ